MEKQFIRKQIELIYRHNLRLFFPRCFVTILLAFFELKEKQYFQNFSIELGSQQGESFLFPVQSDTIFPEGKGYEKTMIILNRLGHRTPGLL